MRGKPVMIELDGKTLTIEQWSKISGVPPRTIRERLYNYGWPTRRAIFQRPMKAHPPKPDHPWKQPILGRKSL